MPEYDFDKPDTVVPMKRARIFGYLYVTEYNNYGDVQFDSPIEPAVNVSKAPIGEQIQVGRETHIVALFSTYRCRVAFVPKGADMKAAESRAFPLTADTEVTRIVHLNTEMTVVSFPDY